MTACDLQKQTNKKESLKSGDKDKYKHLLSLSAWQLLVRMPQRKQQMEDVARRWGLPVTLRAVNSHREPQMRGIAYHQLREAGQGVSYSLSHERQRLERTV